MNTLTTRCVYGQSTNIKHYVYIRESHYKQWSLRILKILILIDRPPPHAKANLCDNLPN